MPSAASGAAGGIMFLPVYIIKAKFFTMKNATK
jgi:hypothetical protein